MSTAQTRQPSRGVGHPNARNLRLGVLPRRVRRCPVTGCVEATEKQLTAAVRSRTVETNNAVLAGLCVALLGRCASVSLPFFAFACMLFGCLVALKLGWRRPLAASRPKDFPPSFPQEKMPKWDAAQVTVILIRVAAASVADGRACLARVRGVRTSLESDTLRGPVYERRYETAITAGNGVQRWKRSELEGKLETTPSSGSPRRLEVKLAPEWTILPIDSVGLFQVAVCPCCRVIGSGPGRAHSPGWSWP